MFSRNRKWDSGPKSSVKNICKAWGLNLPTCCDVQASWITIVKSYLVASYDTQRTDVRPILLPRTHRDMVSDIRKQQRIVWDYAFTQCHQKRWCLFFPKSTHWWKFRQTTKLLGRLSRCVVSPEALLFPYFRMPNCSRRGWNIFQTKQNKLYLLYDNTENW